MHLGVLFAFLGAKPTRSSTGVQHPPDHLFVRTGTSGSDPSRDVANVGTIQVQPDALGQRCHLLLAQARVSAGRTCLRAGIALLDAADERVIRLSANARVRADHLMYMHWELQELWTKAHQFPRSGKVLMGKWLGNIHRVVLRAPVSQTEEP